MTEREEKYERKEIIKYSGNKGFIRDYESGKIDRELKEMEESPAIVRTVRTTTFSEPEKSKTEEKKTEERSRFGRSEEKKEEERSRFGRSEEKSGFKRTEEKKEEERSGFGKSEEKKDQILPENDDYFAQRKARLANLAKQFENMDDDSIDLKMRSRSVSPVKAVIRERSVSPVKTFEPVKTDHIRSRSPIKTNPMQFITPTRTGEDVPVSRSISPSKILSRSVSPTKIVTNITAKPYTSPTKAVSPVRAVSPVKAPSPPRSVPVVNQPAKIIKPDDSLVSSLKAQGFAESESASKLVYDFEKRARSPSPARSPLRRVYTRDDLPAPEQERGRSAVKQTILSSPSQSAVAPRATSPSKPHPLQFVSASVAAAAAGPPKPARTFDAAPPAKSWTDRAKPAAEPDNRCDTPSRKSLQQKRSMFENKTPQPEQIDPALMSMNERKKLFEKNQSVPTPVARFGESVTPAMLAKGRPAVADMTPAEAWKRKREQSPVKLQPPTKKHSPENYVASACRPKHGAEPRVGSAVKPRIPVEAEPVPPSPATPQVGRKVSWIKMYSQNIGNKKVRH